MVKCYWRTCWTKYFWFKIALVNIPLNTLFVKPELEVLKCFVSLRPDIGNANKES